jgi:hypothetical protein
MTCSGTFVTGVDGKNRRYDLSPGNREKNLAHQSDAQRQEAKR